MDSAAALHPATRTLSVIIPVYNSEPTLDELASHLAAALPAAAGRYEVLLINDGSRDGSWHVITGLAARYPWLRGINLMRNYGQHAALLCGVRLARYECIVTLDDDLQHPPEEMRGLLLKLSEDYDVVYGTPVRREFGLSRNLATYVAKLGMRAALGVGIANIVSPYRAFRTDLRRAFDRFAGPFVSLDVLLSWGASRYAAVPVRHEPRRAGQSQYTLRKLISHTFNMVTGLSAAPLRLASIAGFACTMFGVFVLVWVIGRYLLQGDSVPGFPFLASIIAIFSGTQLFALGILGEYLVRLHARMVDRPPYVVASTTDETTPTPATPAIHPV
jgi:glycosyltransferase involved in cell wall biosynthesis